MSNSSQNQSSSEPKLGTAYYIFSVEPRSESQSSNQQQLGAGNSIFHIKPKKVSNSFVPNISQELEKSKITELPEKRKPIEFDKTVDLMLGIEEKSL